MIIKLTKMHGCGNDFIILDYDEYKKVDIKMNTLAEMLCDRHFGIGADGLIIPNTCEDNADLGWFFYNSDGTTAQMCGNGMRCFAKYVYDKKLVKKNEFTVKTLAGLISPNILENNQICVKMSNPILESEKIPFLPHNNLNYRISVKDRTFEGHAISMGNPHFVIFVQKDENLSDLAMQYGYLIESSAEFPEKTNVEFVKIKSEHELDLCVWERGCGITLACGTGACAATVAGILNGFIKNFTNVNLPGGIVNVRWNGSKENTEYPVFLTGPAEYSFTAEFNIKK